MCPIPIEESPAYDDGKVGVYVHLPYCERICPYCDFAVVAARRLAPEVEARYVAALRVELEQRAPDFAGRSLASVYFGGGTPSLFRPESIAELLRAALRSFPSDATIPEITLELNPSTTEIARLPGFRAAGVDRLSVGIQSFDDTQLKRLGRAHRAEMSRETLRAVRRAGFDNVSIDLIFAGPDQRIEDLERDLEALLEFSPEHVSTYELTFEPETPFGRALVEGKIAPSDEERTIRMIEVIEERLVREGYERYEISSYAKPGRRARHNARYWQRQAVLAIGMGAHSTEARDAHAPHGARRANPRTLDAWLDAVESGRPPGEVEELSVETARGEAIFLGLRQREGVDAARFRSEFGQPPRAYFGRTIDRLVERGWLCEGHPAEGDLRLTAPGRLLADSVAAEFVEGVEAPRNDA